MSFAAISSALDRAVALRFPANSTIQAGGDLQLTVSVSTSARARSIFSEEPTRASASAFGLGVGESKFLSDPFFTSPNLTLNSGGGLIQGTVEADATAISYGSNSADAEAINVGVGNITYNSRYSGNLRIGQRRESNNPSSQPFTAKATAGSSAVVFPQQGTESKLNATALVRGLEGGDNNVFKGLPDAVVEAEANLQLPEASGFRTTANAKADAIGISGGEGFTIMGVQGRRDPGDPIPDPAEARIGGDATAKLNFGGLPQGTVDITASANATGIENALIYGAPILPTSISGFGLSVVENNVSTAPASVQTTLTSLKGVGIKDTEIFSGRGSTVVSGFGGVVSGNLQPGYSEAAGISNTKVFTADGDDTLVGYILDEKSTGLDANGDGILSEKVFLDGNIIGSAGFAGLQQVEAYTGRGNDMVTGSSLDSRVYTLQDKDAVMLERAKNSYFNTGLADDVVVISDIAEFNRIEGGSGNDILALAQFNGTGEVSGFTKGSGNTLSGGFGQDLVINGAGSNFLDQSNASAALQAASTPAFAKDLADPAFWKSLSTASKENLWRTGTITTMDGIEKSIDTFSNFKAGVGTSSNPLDTLILPSSLASMTDTMWENDNITALFEVDASGKLKVKEGANDARLGLVIGPLQGIQTITAISPFLAYATDTHQLMYDPDGNWANGGSMSIGTVNATDISNLSKANFNFA